MFDGRSSMRATASRVRSPPDNTRTGFSMSSPENRNPPRMLRMCGTMWMGASPASVWYRERRVQARRLVLREMLGDHLVAFGTSARVRRFHTGKHPHHRRLPRSVGSDQGDSIAPLDVQTRPVEDTPRA